MFTEKSKHKFQQYNKSNKELAYKFNNKITDTDNYIDKFIGKLKNTAKYNDTSIDNCNIIKESTGKSCDEYVGKSTAIENSIDRSKTW